MARCGRWTCVALLFLSLMLVSDWVVDAALGEQDNSRQDRTAYSAPEHASGKMVTPALAQGARKASPPSTPSPTPGTTLAQPGNDGVQELRKRVNDLTTETNQLKREKKSLVDAKAELVRWIMELTGAESDTDLGAEVEAAKSKAKESQKQIADLQSKVDEQTEELAKLRSDERSALIRAVDSTQDTAKQFEKLNDSTVLGLLVLGIVVLAIGVVLYFASRSISREVEAVAQENKRVLSEILSLRQGGVAADLTPAINASQKLKHELSQELAALNEIVTRADQQRTSTQRSLEEQRGDINALSHALQTLQSWTGTAEGTLEEISRSVRGVAGILQDLEPDAAKELMKRYYCRLAQEIGDAARQSFSPIAKSHIDRLTEIDKSLTELRGCCPQSIQNLVTAFIEEIREALPHRDSAEIVDQKVQSLVASWNRQTFLQSRLLEDKAKLFQGGKTDGFGDGSPVFSDLRRAELDFCERLIRDQLLQEANQSGESAERRLSEMMSQWRKLRIKELLDHLESSVPKADPSSQVIDGHVRNILDHLDLEEMQVAVNKEEFSESRHERVGSTANTQYPNNTIVRVVGRGIQEKNGGRIMVKARVITAQR